MLKTTPAAPVAAAVPAQPGAPAAPARGRHRSPREHSRVKTGVLVALVFGLLAAGTTFAVHLGLAAGRANGQPGPAGSAGPAVGGSAATTLQVLSVSPDNSADPLTPANPVRIVFSAPLTARSPLPTFSPAIAGGWRAVANNTIVFTPAVTVAPATEVTLRIPGGRHGMRSVTGGMLAAPVTAVFQAGGWSTFRLEQLLAQLNYLPMTWNSQSGTGPGATVATSYLPGQPVAAVPASGVLTWQSGYPQALTSQWQPGRPGVILTGALMAFESAQGLPLTGGVTSGVWQALLSAVARGQHNPNGYTFALVQKAHPDTITIWHNGQVVMHGVANTGAPATPTPDGTWPVYLRRPAQVMRGLYPNGKPYADPVQYVTFFHGNYAVHSMKRASYGTAQSQGCVELPLNEARQAYPYLTYGTLVAVTGGPALQQS